MERHPINLEIVHQNKTTKPFFQACYEENAENILKYSDLVKEGDIFSQMFIALNEEDEGKYKFFLDLFKTKDSLGGNDVAQLFLNLRNFSLSANQLHLLLLSPYSNTHEQAYNKMSDEEISKYIKNYINLFTNEQLLDAMSMNPEQFKKHEHEFLHILNIKKMEMSKLKESLNNVQGNRNLIEANLQKIKNNPDFWQHAEINNIEQTFVQACQNGDLDTVRELTKNIQNPELIFEQCIRSLQNNNFRTYNFLHTYINRQGHFGEDSDVLDDALANVIQKAEQLLALLPNYNYFIFEKAYKKISIDEIRKFLNSAEDVDAERAISIALMTPEQFELVRADYLNMLNRNGLNLDKLFDVSENFGEDVETFFEDLHETESIRFAIKSTKQKLGEAQTVEQFVSAIADFSTIRLYDEEHREYSEAIVVFEEYATMIASAIISKQADFNEIMKKCHYIENYKEVVTVLTEQYNRLNGNNQELINEFRDETFLNICQTGSEDDLRYLLEKQYIENLPSYETLFEGFKAVHERRDAESEEMETILRDMDEIMDASVDEYLNEMRTDIAEQLSEYVDLIYESKKTNKKINVFIQMLEYLIKQNKKDIRPNVLNIIRNKITSHIQVVFDTKDDVLLIKIVELSKQLFPEDAEKIDKLVRELRDKELYEPDEELQKEFEERKRQEEYEEMYEPDEELEREFQEKERQRQYEEMYGVDQELQKEFEKSQSQEEFEKRQRQDASKLLAPLVDKRKSHKFKPKQILSNFKQLLLQDNLDKESLIESFYLSYIDKESPEFSQKVYDGILEMFQNKSIQKGELNYETLFPYMKDDLQELNYAEQFEDALEKRDVLKMESIVKETQDKELIARFNEFLKGVVESSQSQQTLQREQIAQREQNIQQFPQQLSPYPVNERPLRAKPLIQSRLRAEQEYDKIQQDKMRWRNELDEHVQEFRKAQEKLESDKIKLRHAWKESQTISSNFEEAWASSREAITFDQIWADQKRMEQLFQQNVQKIEDNIAQIEEYERQFIERNQRELFDLGIAEDGYYNMSEFDRNVLQRPTYQQDPPQVDLRQHAHVDASQQRITLRLPERQPAGQPARQQPGRQQPGRQAPQVYQRGLERPQFN